MPPRHIIAAVARAPRTDFSLETVEIDAPRADEILVRVVGVGLCHTDLSVRDRMASSPMVLGHEGSGIVEEVGSEITKVIPGDRVALSFQSCGTCSLCVGGKPSYCRNFQMLNFGGVRPDGSKTLKKVGEAIAGNFFGQSSFASYALAYERNVVKVPDDVPLELMGPLGCGVQTGAGGVMRSLNCEKNSSIVIVGGGSVGLSALLGAVVQGCNPIIVVEPHAARRALALNLGATHVIDPMASTDLTGAIRAIAPMGVDYAFDTTGLLPVIQSVLASLGQRGTLGFVGGATNPEAAISLPFFMALSNGLTVKGIVEGDSDPDVFIPELIALYRAGKFPFDRLVTTYRFDAINKAVADQHAGTVVKAILLMA